MTHVTLLLLLVTATSAIAAPSINCAPARVLRLSDGAKGLRLAASSAEALDPIANGLDVVLATEPETTAEARIFEASLPAAGFVAEKKGARYDDPTGAIGGITSVRVRARKNDTTILLRTNAAAVGDTINAPMRFVAQAGEACGRTCAAPCKRSRKGALRCKRSPSDALCGLAAGCEHLGLDAGGTTRACLLPYPSDFFTTDDATTATGRRVAYTREALPENGQGVHIDPTPYNVLDGFSAGPVISVHVAAGVDLAASNVPSPATLPESLDPGSPTILIDADAAGCQRVLHFGENDVSLDVGEVPVAPPNQLFLVRPAVRLTSGRRYIVALRGLVDQAGATVEPGLAFRTLRDGTKTKLASLEARRAKTTAMLDKLETDCGVARDSVQLAWDFTTASDASVQRYLLHMRDETFAQLPGDTAPLYTIDTVETDPVGDPRICRRIRGTYAVPLWTTFNGPGSVLNLDPETDLPVQNGVATDIPFTAVIPCSLVNGPTAGRPIVYGHGLLGDGDGEVTAGNLRTLADTYGFVLAATDWQGFSEKDLPAVLGFLDDLSDFRQLSERLHQGVLNQLVLARLLKSPNGFAANAAFMAGAEPLIDTQEVYYYGISQGGIEGGVVMALAQDITRGVLGVPAANYSTLLHRSVDFEPFFLALKAFYPDAVARSLLLGLIQQIWDRSEPNGWYHHTLPGTLPDTPEHEVLIHMARSDAEVANLGTQIMVRSMGIPQLTPVNESYVGITEMAAPFDGSAFVESHFGLPDPPITNIPPAENDVHGQMRGIPAIQKQIDMFLRPTGTVQQFCADACDPD